MTVAILALGLILDWKAIGVSMAGSTADTGSTIRALRNPKCSEANPLLGPHPSTAKLVAYSAAGTGVIIVTHSLINQHAAHSGHPRFWRGLASGLAYGAGGVGLATAAHNVGVCGW